MKFSGNTSLGLLVKSTSIEIENMPVLMLKESCMMKNTKLPVIVDQPQVVSEIVGPLDLEPSEALQIICSKIFLKNQVAGIQ